MPTQYIVVVCLSICPSQAGMVSKRLGSPSQHRDSSLQKLKISANFRWVTPNGCAKYRWGGLKAVSANTAFILLAMQF